MIKTVILNSFGVFVKQGFHQTGSSPRIVSLKFRLAEIPPYQIYLILVDQFIEDREQAIRTAIMTAPDKATILLAGKGHETYQITGTEKRHFDEKEIVDGVFKGME